MPTKIKKLTKQQALELIKRDFPSTWEFNAKYELLDALEREYKQTKQQDEPK